MSIEPRIGIAITGGERKKRNLLVQVIKKKKVEEKVFIYPPFFKKSDIKKVNEAVNRDDPKLLNSDDSSLLNSIVIHILFLIERIKNKLTL